MLSDEDLALETYREICAPWRQNMPPNRNCVVGHGLREDQNGWFSRLRCVAALSAAVGTDCWMPSRQTVRTVSILLSIERNRADRICRFRLIR